ncbi:MAG: Spy/CpxP family protein refolding chaperone [Methylotenera sp.]|uniref:Spy/CpxP family protein refolding chaperone n=1 Tax=Methylotenera sp. TaxID=2051956 RepID=UPI0024873553|nr:Spy/CpxP family protein refolding chaperone [Methylotenera sp.]MDI1308004.1 Spy/CpxP family protein refolding chaperone [Methylotenera sp.]
MNTPFRFKQTFSFKQMLLASFLAVSLPAASLAQAEHDGDKEPRCERGDKSNHDTHEGKAPYLRCLDLTSAQKDQLFNLNHAQIPVTRDQHKQHQQLMKELRETAQAEKFDDAKIQQLSDKAAKLEKEKVLAWARHDSQVFALLTPEQRKKAREFKMEERRFGHGDDRRDNDNKRPTRFKQQNRPLENRNM